MSLFFDGAAAAAKQHPRMDKFFEDESIGLSLNNRPRFKILVGLYLL